MDDCTQQNHLMFQIQMQAPETKERQEYINVRKEISTPEPRPKEMMLLKLEYTCIIEVGGKILN